MRPPPYNNADPRIPDNDGRNPRGLRSSMGVQLQHREAVVTTLRTAASSKWLEAWLLELFSTVMS